MQAQYLQQSIAIYYYSIQILFQYFLQVGPTFYIHSPYRLLISSSLTEPNTTLHLDSETISPDFHKFSVPSSVLSFTQHRLPQVPYHPQAIPPKSNADLFKNYYPYSCDPRLNDAFQSFSTIAKHLSSSSGSSLWSCCQPD